MTSKSRWLVFLVSTPLVVARGGRRPARRVAASRASRAFPHLRVFDDVLALILGNYVEPVDVDKVMDGAMRGLTDGLDTSSAYPAARRSAGHREQGTRCRPATSAWS